MDIKVVGSWDFYHWGKGWDSLEQKKAWDEYWDNFNNTHMGFNWRNVKIGSGLSQENLLVCGKCVVWLHPMNYTAYYHGSGVIVQTIENGKCVTRREFLLEELEKICREVAEVCGGTYKHKETEVEISTKV